MSNLPVATQWIHSNSPAFTQTPIDAVAMVVVQSSAGTEKGTGWLVSDQMLVTNEHVVRNGAPGGIEAHFADGSQFGVSAFAAVDASLDLAVLELQGMTSATPLKIDLSPPQVGTQVYTLGFPLAYNGPAPLMTVGHVAGFETHPVSGAAAPLKRIVLNAAINSGNSGGPVFLWEESSVRGVAVSKHAPISLFLQSAITALADNKSGITFTGTDAQGNLTRFVESQLVADVLQHFRSMTQVVIGSAIPADDVATFLTTHNVPWSKA